uniref:Secreted protein n=1 Tax=Globodera rostochiensis TaxID=31243 RepID=A0A914I595_GLORO
MRTCIKQLSALLRKVRNGGRQLLLMLFGADWVSGHLAHWTFGTLVKKRTFGTLGGKKTFSHTGHLAHARREESIVCQMSVFPLVCQLSNVPNVSVPNVQCAKCPIAS